MATCPHCSKPLPEQTSAPSKGEAAHYQPLEDSLRLQIKDLNRRWSLHPFSSGWRKVDIAVRVLLIFVLVGLVFMLDAQIGEAQFHGTLRLEGHREFMDHVNSVSDPMAVDFDRFKRNYQSLYVSAAEMFEAELNDRRVHLFVLLAFIALMAVSALGSYRTHKEFAKLRAGFEFLFTYEGREVLDRVAPKREEDKS